MTQVGETTAPLAKGLLQDASPGDRTSIARITIILLMLFYLAVALASLNVGAAQISLLDATFGAVTSAENTGVRDRIILFDIRLPRLILGSLIGAALAVSGAILQSLFRNPLADPGLIGISAGASFGAVLVIVLGGTSLSFITNAFGLFSLPVMSFVGALAVTFFLHRISTTNGQTSIVTMLLAGIALQAFAFALTGILIFLADDQQLRDLTFWSLGSLAGATWPKILASGPIILLSFAVLPFLAVGLNAMALGEATAFHLGIPVQRLKNFSVTVSAAATGAAVAVSGGIGFVGIVVPHLLRLLIGPDNRYLIPASALLGACLLIFADMIARTIVAPAELPIGIITALAGAPFFIWLLVRKRGVLDT
ncbi:MAG: iron ABC transporter permease [Pseudomonadota bacterium]